MGKYRSNFVEFENLDKVLNDPLSHNKFAKESSDCLGEFIYALSNFSSYAIELKENELANLTKSLQNWMIRRNYKDCKATVNIGDIFFADLGITYKLETSYPHPVVILENVGNMLLVVPTTTSSDILDSAYHPEKNNTGNKFFRKVYKDEDGFEDTCAIVLSNARTINAGRLLEPKGKMENINNKDSLFREIKKSVFEFLMPKEFIDYEKLIKEHEQLEKDFNELKKKYDHESELLSNTLMELDRINRLTNENQKKSS